ncbi:MAG: HpcH/HpaI aldolase/citrate lyase family protein [Sphaerochaetaceae bacterium]
MDKMNSNQSLKSRIDNGEMLIGSWLQIGHPAIMECMCAYPFDWLTVDLEHTDISMETFTQMLRGAARTGMDVLARVKENSLLDIRQVLDMGATGVIVPLVSSAEEAKRAVSAAKYAPKGERGFAFCRANEYGHRFDEYSRKANDETVVIVMIETKQGVENINEILSVDGVDGVLIGPYDMSGSFGVPGQTQSECVQQAMVAVVEACKRYGKVAGIHQVEPDEKQIKNVIDKGFGFIAIGMDTVFLGKAIEESLVAISCVLDSAGVRK